MNASDRGARAPYLGTRRRMLLDMHIPDWEPEFLSRYDPQALADLYVVAGAEAVMVYAKSHMGLCNWPTAVGRMHANLRGRDVLGEIVDALHARGILVCGYHSVGFDNDVAERHPEWRVRAAEASDGRPFPFIGPRYGVLCLNNPDYRAYEAAQVTDLLSRYRFDAYFTDMVFWGGACACEICVRRFAEESGYGFPVGMDWNAPDWSAFARARQRWSEEMYAGLYEVIRGLAPDIPVYHNFAAALGGWLPGVSLSGFRRDTFVGGDMYGDRDEQLLVCKLMRTVTGSRPPEYMTSTTPALRDHVAVKSERGLLKQAFGAAAQDCAFLLIDAIEPDGTVAADLYELAGRVFRQTAPYQEYLGGAPLEQAGVYYSPDANVDLDGDPLAATASARHRRAAVGACRALQRAHIPFGVLSPQQLGELDRWDVIVLPDVVRMSADEVAAFRGYVDRGGRLYASGGTSLADLDGNRFDDFALGDVFGVRRTGTEQGDVVYLTPSSPDLAEAIRPQRHLAHQARSDARLKIVGTPVPRLANAGAAPLATLTLPYAYPDPGTLDDHRFASIHSSPPFRRTEHPAIVSAADGRVVYSAVPIEATQLPGHERTFARLVRGLIGDSPIDADAPSTMWIEVYDQPEHDRVAVMLLDHTTEDDSPAAAATIVMSPPEGHAWTAVRRAPDGIELGWRRLPDGSAEVRVDGIDPFALITLHRSRVG